MLGKLIKYDLKSTKKEFFLTYMACFFATILVTAMLANMDIFSNGGFLVSLLSIVFIGACFAILCSTGVVILITIVNLYRKKMFGDEAYLTHCLPVKTYTLTLSKLMTISIWLFGLCLVAMVTIVTATGILSLSYTGNFFEYFGEFFNGLSHFMQAENGSYLLLILCLLVSLLCLISEGINMSMVLYFALTLGHFFYGRWKKGAVVIISIVATFSAEGFLLILVANRFYDSSYTFMDTGLTTINQHFGFLASIMSVGVLINLSLCAIVFWANNAILKKRLELAA